MAELNKNADNLRNTFADTRDILVEVQKALGKNRDTVKEAATEYRKLEGLAQKFLLDQDKIVRLTDKQLQQEQDKAAAAAAEIKRQAESLMTEKGIAEVTSQVLTFRQDLTAEQIELLSAAKDNFAVEKEMLAAIDAELERRKDVNKSLGAAGHLLKGLNEIAGPFAKAFGLDQVAADMEDFADKAAKGGKRASQLQVLGHGLKRAFGQLGNTLRDPAVIFTALAKSFGDFEKANKEVRNLTGQSATNMNTFNSSMVSSIDAAKTIGSLSKEIGINVNAAFSGETITAAAELTELMGTSAKATANLALRAEAFGGTLKGTSTTVFATTQEFIKQNKSALNVGAVMEDVGNASGALALSLGNSTEALTEAAAGAASLGINLAEAEKIADTLLNFEESISAELEAELLTGKEINLEAARQAALNNDIATLTKEIGNNQAVLSAFSSGNRIQQDAIAKSLGMSKDQVSKMIFLQMKSNDLTDEQAAKAAGITEETAKRLGAQDSIKKSIEKITSALAPVLSVIADAIAGLTGNMGGLIATFSVLAFAYLPKIAKGAKGIASSFKTAGKAVKDLVTKGFGGMMKGLEQSNKQSQDLSKKLGGTPGKGIKKFFQNLAGGLRSLGKGNTLKGVLTLALFAPAAILNIPAIPFLSFIGMVPLKMLQSNLQGLGAGLKSLSKGMVGALTLLVLGPALALMLLGLPFLAFMSIPGIGALIAANFALLAGGLAAFGNPGTAVFILIGIGLLAALGVAMIPFAFALSLLTPLVEAFGTIFIGIFSALPPIIAAVAEGIVTVFGGIGDLITTVVGNLILLADPSVIMGLYQLAPALLALGFALPVLSYGLAGFALSVGLLTAITGGTPFGMFEELAEYAPGIDLASNALSRMSIALGGLQTALAGVDTEKLSDVMNPGLGGVVLGLGTAAIQGVTDAVGSIAGALGAGPEEDSNQAVVKELQQVKEILSQILGKEGSVKIDSTKAGTAFSMGTSRLQ